jgi:small GTP-binding protein
MPYLATIGEGANVIHIWDLNCEILLGVAASIPTVKYTSAKIVLVGESNAGKSCLAMRLAENRYPDEHEQGTTHGMRFWPMKADQLSARAGAPEGERRDLVLWDMGGQDEYRLVHQLFFDDTAQALVLFDPTRGRTAFDEVEGWNKRLEKQLGGRRAVKLLVGAKVDEPTALIDRKAVELLVRDCEFDGFCETSALTGRGIPELREAMARAIDWAGLARTHRPELFQRIRDEIEAQRVGGEVVLYERDLNRVMRKQFPASYEPQAVKAVADQLATQGVIAITRLASGERVLILQIGEIERYAGSLIVAARDNPRGVPVLEMRRLNALDPALPGISDEKRLPRSQELAVLESTVQLLISHGICFQHEGLLVFPTLFRPTERESGETFPHAVSLYYDFSGAIDNIYASLAAWLAIGKAFGQVRLWQDRAEFEVPGAGACGLRKVDRGGGFAHVDVYFQNETPQKTREGFILFVEEHLRQHGVEIVEHVAITCVCGFLFEEVMIRHRIAEGHEDIGCPSCDRRTQLTEGAVKVRERDPELTKGTWALRTEIEKRRQKLVDGVADLFAAPATRADEPIRILHLSDLHFTADSDPFIRLRPLVADLRDPRGGLGFERLDYLVISGDLTNRATPQEFEVARQFVSGVIEELKMTAERCIVVPGNHDLSWDENVYDWTPTRAVNLETLPKAHYSPQGAGYLIRDQTRYLRRFHNFSHHFYHPLVQRPYPLQFEDQFLSILFEQTRIQFLTLNSSWQIDEWFPNRSGIHQGALVRGLREADDEVRKAKEVGLLDQDAIPLRIAVWHHPVTGNQKIEDDAFMEQLRQARVRLCLHGHIHENRADLFGYLHPSSTHVAGAGSFGAIAKLRPESTPRLYNVIEIPRDHSRITVYTRGMRQDGGAWESYAIWPGDEPGERRAYYVVP